MEPWWVVHVGYVTEDDIRVRMGREGGREGGGGSTQAKRRGNDCHIVLDRVALDVLYPLLFV